LWKHIVGGEEITRGKYIGKTTKSGWKPMGLYPHDYNHAIDLIATDYFINTNKVMDIAPALREVRAYIKEIAEQAKVLDKLGRVDADDAADV
jgi:hypothetical protein